jgi:hypothetical protein
MLLKKIFRITTTTDLVTAIAPIWTMMGGHGTMLMLTEMGDTNLDRE